MDDRAGGKTATAWSARNARLVHAGLLLAAMVAGVLFVHLMRLLEPAAVLISSLVVLIAVVAFYPSVRSLQGGKSFDPFDARHVFVLYFFLQFGVHTIVLLWTGEGFLIGDIRRATDVIVKALLYALLGLASFQLGYALSPRWLQRWLPVPGWPTRRLALRIGVAMGYAIGVGTFLYLMELEGGLVYYFTHIEEIRETRLLGRGMFYYLAGTASVAWLVSCAVATKARGRIPWLHMVLLFVLVVGYLGMGFRLMAIFMILQYVLLRHYLVRRIRFRFRYVPVLAAGLLLMNLYQIYRGISPDRLAETAAELGDQLEKPRVRAELVTGVFHRFQGTDSMVRILEVSDRVGFDLGRTLVRDLVIAPIPRAFWPRKPEPRALELWNRVYFYGTVAEGIYGARVPTLLGELYAYGHIVGVVVGMYLMGVFVRLAYRFLQADPSRSAVMAYSLIFCFVFSVNETLQTHIFLLMVRGAALAAILVFIRVFSLSRQRSA